MRTVRILTYTLLSLLLFPAIVFGQTRTEVSNIGDGNETTVQGPVYTGTEIDLGSLLGGDPYQFEALYLSNEFNLSADGELQEIEFYVTSSVDLSLLSNVEVYIKTTSDSEVEDGTIEGDPTEQGYTLLEGDFDLLGLNLSGVAGDVDLARFELEVPFSVNQGDNISIYTRSTNLADVSLGGNFIATDTGGDDLTRASEPLTLLGIGLGGFGEMEVTSLRPNARFVFETQAVADASNSVLRSGLNEIFANEFATTLITLDVRSETGGNINSGGDDVQFSTTAGSISSATDNGDGTYTAVLTASSDPATATVTATLNGETVGDQVTVDFVETLSDLFCDITQFTTEEEPRVGTITSDTTPRGPLYTNTVSLTLGEYQFETLFLQNELNVDEIGFLRSITFFTDNTIDVDLIESAEFFIKETSQTSLDEGDVSLEDYTFVGDESNLININIDGNSALRIEFDTPILYSGNGNITFHSRQFVLADVNLGGEFNFDSANDDLTNVSQDLLDLLGLGVTVGLTSPENTSERPVADLEFELFKRASLSESFLEADPDRIPADGESTSTITSFIRSADGMACELQAGNLPDFETTAGTLGDVTHEGDTDVNRVGEYTALLTSSNMEEIANVSGSIDGSSPFGDADVEFFLEDQPPSPEFTTIEADPSQITADGESTSEITVTLFDENNERVEEGGFDVELSTTAGTLSDVTDNGDGTYTATLTSSTEAGTAVITGTLEGEDIEDDAEVEFEAAPSPEFTTIQANPNQITADGESTSEVTITLRDFNDDPFTEGGFDVELSTTAGTLGDVTDNDDGTYTAILTSSTEEETAVITGTLEGEDIQDDAEVAFVMDPVQPSPEFTTIEADPTELPADGESTSEITVTLFDENNEPIEEGGFCSDVDLFTTDGTLSDVTDNGDGTCSASLTSSTEPGTAIVTGEISGEEIVDDAEVEFMQLPPNAENTEINASPTRILADGQSTSEVTVVLRDQLGNRVEEGGFDVELFTTAGTLSDVTDNGDGTYTAILTSSTEEETAVITGTLEGEDIEDDAEVEFVDEVLPPSPEFTTITANPTQIFADGESQSEITVTLRDENDEEVGQGGFDVGLETTAGTIGDITDNGDGTYTAMLTSSTIEETAVINGTVEGEDIEDSAEVEFVMDPVIPSAELSTIEAEENEIFADGESQTEVTVTLFDQDNQRIMQGGFEVTLSVTAGTLTTENNANRSKAGNTLDDVIDNDDGTYTAFLTSSEIPETAVITGTIEGEEIQDSDEVEFVIDPTRPDPETIIISAEPTEIPADGQSTSEITVTMLNADGEIIDEVGVCTGLELSTTSGTLSNITEQGDGTCTVTLTSSEDPGEAVISGTIDGENIQDTATVIFQPLDMFSCQVKSVFPNPFLDNATFRIETPDAGRVKVELYDVLGKKVDTIIDQDVTAGEHEVEFNSSHLSSGVYIYRYYCPCKCGVDTGNITHMGRN